MAYPNPHTESKSFNQWLNQVAKPAFTLRRMDLSIGNFSLTRDKSPQADDIVLAKVIEIGQHTGVQKASRERSKLFVGDYLLLAYGNRYAPDQFEAYVPNHLNTCHLVAAGGVAGEVASFHASMDEATLLEPVGLLTYDDGRVVNLADGALPKVSTFSKQAKVILSVGSSMNAGKSTTAANMIHGLSQQGYRVAAAKLTGTGAPGDVNLMKSAGAQLVYDFTDMGYATTFKVDINDVISASTSLIAHLEAIEPDVIVLEIADGLLQTETAKLLSSEQFYPLIDGVMFSAGDAMGAIYGVELLAKLKLPIIGISGKLTASPLAASETRQHTAFPVFTAEAFQEKSTINYLLTATQALTDNIGSINRCTQATRNAVKIPEKHHEAA